MIKFPCFVPLCLSFALHSQIKNDITATVEYHVSYTSKHEKLIDDICQLDIGTCQSLFYSLRKKDLDKNIAAVFEKAGETNNIVDLSSANLIVNRSLLPVKILKRLCGKSVLFVEEFNGQFFGYSRESSIYNNWDILEDTLTIQHLVCHKAQIKKDSVSVIAWFCTDIPFREGPLSYFGLPGLIIKVENSKGWEIEFLGISYAITGERRLMDIPSYSVITETELRKVKQQHDESFKNGQPGYERDIKAAKRKN
jgi:GLPGLI family protein